MADLFKDVCFKKPKVGVTSLPEQIERDYTKEYAATVIPYISSTWDYSDMNVVDKYGLRMRGIKLKNNDVKDILDKGFSCYVSEVHRDDLRFLGTYLGNKNALMGYTSFTMSVSDILIALAYELHKELGGSYMMWVKTMIVNLEIFPDEAARVGQGRNKSNSPKNKNNTIYSYFQLAKMRRVSSYGYGPFANTDPINGINSYIYELSRFIRLKRMEE